MAVYGYQHGNSAVYGSDHVCWDAEGRKRPIVSFAPNKNSEYYVTRTTKTIVQEQILSPPASEIKQTPLWSPGGHQVADDKWQKHPSPVHDIPPEVEFFTKVQNEASKPKFSPMSASTWHPTAKPTGYGSEFKPTNNGYHNDAYDDNNHRTSTYYKEPSSHGATKTSHYRHVDPILVDTFDERVHAPKEATVGAHSRWVGPSPTMWASPPSSNLSKPTSDIPTAIEILKEVAKPFVSTEPRYAETIDSVEAAKKYGNYGKLNHSPKRYGADDDYMTIDSREAARKYQGAMV